MAKYGFCPQCGADLIPKFFIEKETVLVGPSGCSSYHETGRQRRAVDYLFCDECGAKEPVDDSFDGPWH